MTAEDLVSSAVAGALLTPHPYHFFAVIGKWICAHIVIVAAAIIRSRFK